MFTRAGSKSGPRSGGAGSSSTHGTGASGRSMAFRAAAKPATSGAAKTTRRGGAATPGKAGTGADRAVATKGPGSGNAVSPNAAYDDFAARESRMDEAAQASTLRAAAEKGAAFCEECDRARHAAKASA